MKNLSSDPGKSPIENSRVLVRAWALAVAIVTILAACSPGPSSSSLPEPVPTPPWAERRMRSGFLRLAEPEPPCRECLVLERVISSLRDERGHDALPGGWRNGVVDKNGNLWVGQGAMVRIFDQEGVFLRDVGRQGQGPFEFQSARPIFTDTEGNVHIHDSVNYRETIVNSDFALVDTRQTARASTQIAPLPGGRYVTARWFPTPDRIGFPLHVFDGLEITHSFGISTDGEQEPLTQRTARRILAADGMGHIFSAEMFRYLIEVWTPDGARIMGLEGPQLNEREIPPGPWTMDDNPPASGYIFNIRIFDTDRLWVISRQRKENWREAAIELIAPDGSVRVEPVGGTIDGFYRSRIDVIDLTTATLIASGTYDSNFVQLLEGQLVAEFGLTDEEDWRVGIWKAALTRQ